jgi:diguanylate cyclase (GGDEF)-like protein
MKMTANLSELILVVDEEIKDVVYCNKNIPLEHIFDFLLSDNTEQYALQKNKILTWDVQQPEQWEIKIKKNNAKKYFRVNSYRLKWRKRSAYVHVITDITKEKLEKRSLSNKAYLDPVTSVHNRRFFDEYMKGVLEDKKLITLAYLDLDGLKFVNDNYGHTEGDSYIISFAETLRKNFRKDDVFARIGGDEFCLVLEGQRAELTTAKLEMVRESLIKSNTKPYPVSFSYGVHEIDCSDNDITLAKIMKKADAKMYKYKRANKKNRK